MNYNVDLTPDAEQDLARPWLQHVPGRQAINEALDRIEAELSIDAHRKGVPIDNYRCYVDRPLKVLFVAIPDDNLARIAQIEWVGL